LSGSERSSSAANSGGHGGPHYSTKKVRFQGEGSSSNAEAFCITRDGRLMVFRIGSITPIVVGEFSRFTRGLQVWVPVKCEGCDATQLINLGDNYVDGVHSHTQSGSSTTIDSGRTRDYSSDFECAACRKGISVSIRFSFYASSGDFHHERTMGGRIVPLAGLREFFTSAKTSSIPNYKSATEGSLMHFG
jgi:hypothetical protein